MKKLFSLIKLGIDNKTNQLQKLLKGYWFSPMDQMKLVNYRTELKFEHISSWIMFMFYLFIFTVITSLFTGIVTILDAYFVLELGSTLCSILGFVLNFIMVIGFKMNRFDTTDNFIFLSRYFDGMIVSTYILSLRVQRFILNLYFTIALRFRKFK